MGSETEGFVLELLQFTVTKVTLNKTDVKISVMSSVWSTGVFWHQMEKVDFHVYLFLWALFSYLHVFIKTNER